MKIGVGIKRLLLLTAAVVWSAGSQAMAADTIMLDLTTAGAIRNHNGGIFEQIEAFSTSTGTGVIQPFLKINSNKDIERGYNTGGTVEYDTASGQWTTALLLDDVPVVRLSDGINYRQFLLDINQSGSASGRFLSVDEIVIYQASVGNLTDWETDPQPFGGAASFVWKLDDGPGFNPQTDDAWILMDYKLNTGSGSGDMFAYIPNSLFSDLDYVYLYSVFGIHRPNTAGFEEWAVLLSDEPPPPPPPPPSVPAPSALLLVLGGSGLAVSLNRRKQL